MEYWGRAEANVTEEEMEKITMDKCYERGKAA